MQKKIIPGILLLLVIATAGFITWAEMPLPAMPEAFQAVADTSTVQVENGKWLTFSPKNETPTIGFIIYPGGRVNYRAYAPTAQKLADMGYQVYLTRMPLNLAIFGVNLADEIIAANPQIQTWAIGGHSLGGAMACMYVYQHPGKVQGLVLWAAYPAENNDLSNSDIQVISIHGSQDGLATREKMDASIALLPAQTTWLEIAGGNHAQMGWYGLQPCDGIASISREEQQTQLVAGTGNFLSHLEK